MQVTKRQQVLLGGLLLLAVSVVQAKKPDSDNNYRDESSQGRQSQNHGRDINTDSKQIDRRSNDRRDDYPSRYEQPSQRYDQRYPDSRGNEARPQSRGMSLSEAVSEAERRTGGRVLSADPREENGELYYRVKVLTPNGRVQILYLDAR